MNEFISIGFSKAKDQINKVANSQNKLNRASQKTTKEIISMEREIRKLHGLQSRGIILTSQQTTRLSNLSRQYELTGGSVKRLTTKTRSLFGAFTKARIAFFNYAVVAGVLYGIFRALIKPTIDLEDKMVGVAKTTGLTTDEIKDLKKELLDLSTILPISVQDLADIAKVAGQLGVAKGDIGAFTKSVALISQVTNLTAQEAATNFAKIANAFQIPINDIDMIGNVLNELENTTAATTKDIINSLTRVGGASKSLGFSFATTAAAVSTLISAGFGAERAGTRLQKLFVKMASSSKDFAKISGKSTAQFKLDLKNNANKALEDVLKGLKDNETGIIDVSRAYEAAGTVGGFALVTLAQNLDNFTQNQKTANEQVDNGTSVMSEFERSITTTIKQWEIFKNTLIKDTEEIATSITDNLINPILTLTNDLRFISSLSEKKKKGGIIGALFGPFLEVTGLKELFNNFHNLVNIAREIELVDDAAEDGGGETQTSKLTDELADLTFATEEYFKAKTAVNDVEGKSILQRESEISDLDAITERIKGLHSNDYPNLIKVLNAVFEEQNKVIDSTEAYKNSIKSLRNQLSGTSDSLSDIRSKISDVNKEISNILNRKFTIRGISETGIGGLVRQQELELAKAEFATRGLGTAEEFLRNASLLTADSINSQTDAVKRLTEATDLGKDSYEAWKETLRETIRELLINSQDIERDVTEVVRKAQTELLGITRFERGGTDQFTVLKDNLNNLRDAQGIFFGEEKAKLDLSEAKRRDRVNGINESANAAISALNSERSALELLEAQEDSLIKTQKELNDEIKRFTDLMNDANDSTKGFASSIGGGGGGSGGGVASTFKGRPGTSVRTSSGQVIHGGTPGHSFNDFISRPGQPAESFSSQDTIIGVKNPGQLGGDTNVTININGYNQNPRNLAIEIKRQLASL